MKLMYGFEYPAEFKPKTSLEEANWDHKDFRISISTLQKELKMAKAKSCILTTNAKINANGQLYGRVPGGSGAMLEFTLGGYRHTWIVDNFRRTEDNIYGLSQSVHHFRMFKAVGTKSMRNPVRA